MYSTKSEVHSTEVSNDLYWNAANQFTVPLSLVVNENNANPTFSVLGSESIRSVGVIRPNRIRHYLAGLLF